METVLWSQKTEQAGTSWMKAQLTIQPFAQPLTLIFRAIHGTQVTSDIALDEITAWSGACDQYGLEQYPFENVGQAVPNVPVIG